MKKIFTLVTAMLIGSCGVALAQDVVEVQDSETVAQESVAPDSVAVPQETKASVVEEEEEENLFAGKKKDYGKSIKKTWEYRVFLCANTSSGTSSITSDESGGLELGVGYNFTSWFYAGVSTGFIHDFGGTSGMEAGDIMPWLVDLQLRWNVKRKLSLFLEGRAGIFGNITPDEKNAGHRDCVHNGEHKADSYDFKYPNYTYYDIQPGLLFRLTEKLDMRLSFGYGYAKPYNETEGFEGRTYDETILTGKFGFSYRFR